MSKYINILKRMEDIFKEESIATILRTTEEEKDLPMDILTVMLDDFSEKGNEWLAEFSFLPLQNGADNTAYMSIAITLTEDMTMEECNRITWFITRFNHYVPYGAFSISADGNTLTYKLCSPVMDNGNEDDLFDAFSLLASHALDFMDNFGSLLEAIIEEDVEPDVALAQFFNGDQAE